MKRIILPATTSALCALHLSAAVPLSWTVETSRLSPAVWDVVRGETIALEATFNTAGKPFAMDGEACSIFWQTNGMGSAWWTAPAAAVSNRVSAVFTPAMDPGASSVIGFLGSSGSVYRAAFTLRFRHGPGSTPNVMPLPTPVIDFAKVRVLNPPWPTGVDTNVVRDIARAEISVATNAIRRVDGAARPLPKYLHELSFDDTYPEAADEYYRSRGDGKTDGGCSAVRSGGYLYRNFDFPFDDRAEFVVRCVATAPSPSCPNGRFASVGVAQVGTNLTEAIVTSGKPSRWYKSLPGATVDGINERGVVCEVNVVDGTPPHRLGGDIHPLAAVRWALDNGTSAGMAASNLAARIMWPAGWTQNFHWMVADERETWIVENGTASNVVGRAVMTNFRLNPKTYGAGWERYMLLSDTFASITNAWWTLAYSEETSPRRYTDLETTDESVIRQIFDAWLLGGRESHRGQTYGYNTWWQTVHTSIYDITNRVLRIAVQEQDDWYVFALAKNGTDEAKVREIAEEVVAPVASSVTGLQSSVSGLQSSKRDMTNLTVSVGFGWLDLPATLSEVEIHYDAQGDPEGNHWHWQGRDSESGIRWGTKPGTYFFWPTAEAASNALEVVWDYYPDEVVAHRGSVKDRLALQSSITGLASSVSGLQSSKLDKASVDPTLTTNGVPADAAAVGALPYVKYNIDGPTLQLEPAHYDQLPHSIDFSNYNNVNLPLFSSFSGNIYGTLTIFSGDNRYTGINGGSMSIFNGDTTTDINGGYVSVYGDNGDVANLDAYGLSLNNQTTYSLSSINYYGNSLSFPDREGHFSLDDETSLLAMLGDAAPSNLASHPTFSNAVLSVGIDTNILATVAASTNAVAQIGDFYAAFADIGITPTQGGMTLAGLLAALVAAVTFLKKNKADKSDLSGITADDIAAYKARPWAPSTQYVVGDCVTHGATGEWSGLPDGCTSSVAYDTQFGWWYWEVNGPHTAISTETWLTEADALAAETATFDFGGEIGEIVAHRGKQYHICTAIHFSGATFDPSKWRDYTPTFGLETLRDFFSDSNGLLASTIAAKLPYPLYAVPTETGLLKDRAINITSLASVIVPDDFTDLLIRATVATGGSLPVTMPTAITTKHGDTFPDAEGEYLITITKTGAAEAFVRVIKLEVANA